MAKYIFQYLVFPGFLFAACMGLFAGWFDRKLSARLQWRLGPPWYQNFIDIIKLLGKETIIPEGAGLTFLLSPALALLSTTLVATLLGRAIAMPLESVVGDLIVALYLLTVPAIALICGASASRNPLASVGASREMKMVLGYELPFLLSVVTVIIKSKGSIQLGQIINNQINFGSTIFSLSGMLAFVVAVFCVQAKLGFVPFDASEADQEIMGGTLIEYSGAALALFKLTRAVALYTLVLFLIVLFMGRDTRAAFVFIKFVGILTVFILIKNTNPRLRIEQALRFFWGPMTVLGIISVVLAVFGR